MNKMPTETMTGPEAEVAETPKIKRKRRKIARRACFARCCCWCRRCW